MANSDKNILITPNVGSGYKDPTIQFIGAGSSVGTSTITASIYPANNGTLSFDSNQGTVFSISGILTTGTIFSVNPISGIPIIDVNADRTIALNPYGGNTGIGTNTPTAKLEVQNGDIRVGIDTSQGLILTSPNGTQFRLTVDDGGILTAVGV